MDFKTAFGQKDSRLAYWRRFEQWTESTAVIAAIHRGGVCPRHDLFPSPSVRHISSSC